MTPLTRKIYPVICGDVFKPSNASCLIKMILPLILFVQVFHYSTCQESAHYLQSAVKDLRKLSGKQSTRRVNLNPTLASSTESQLQRRFQSNDEDVPPLSLTKGELAALYEAAVAKGHTINLDTGDDTYVNAAVHQIDDDDGSKSKNHETYSSGPHGSVDGGGDDTTGYYYYYYPIKNFINEMTSQVEHSVSDSSGSSGYSYHKPSVYKDYPEKHTTTYRPPYQYHSHVHQHNVTIKTQPAEKKNKGLEPLLMAISGFAGMAVMYLLSMVVFPKLGIKPKPKIKDFHKKGKIEDLARVALEAIEGNCAERFACELGKTARTFNLQNNRFIKLLKRMAPTGFGRHIDKVRKYSNRQLTCTAIPCTPKKNVKVKNDNKNKQNQKKKPPQKKH